MMGGADKKSRIITILLFSASVTLFIQLWSKEKMIDNLRFNLAVTQRELRQSSNQVRRRSVELTTVSKQLKSLSEQSKTLTKNLEEEKAKKGGCELCQEEKNNLEKRYEDTIISMADEKQAVEDQLKKIKSENKQMSSKILTLTDLQEKDKKVIEVLKISLSKLHLDETLKDMSKETFPESQIKNEDKATVVSLKNTDKDNPEDISLHKDQEDDEEEEEEQEEEQEEEETLEKDELGKGEFLIGGVEDTVVGSEKGNDIVKEEVVGSSYQRQPEEIETQEPTRDDQAQQPQKAAHFRRRRGHLVKRRKAAAH